MNFYTQCRHSWKSLRHFMRKFRLTHNEGIGGNRVMSVESKKAYFENGDSRHLKGALVNSAVAKRSKLLE